MAYLLYICILCDVLKICYVCVQGVLGSQNSGKSALVHRYLTGAYLPEESPEGMICDKNMQQHCAVLKQ